MKRLAGAPAKIVPGAKEIRASEIATCTRELGALLDRYETTLQVTQHMQLAHDGTPRYQFRVDVVARAT